MHSLKGKTLFIAALRATCEALCVVRNKAAYPFEHSFGLLPVREMSGIGEGLVLCVR